MTARTESVETSRKEWVAQAIPMIADEIIYKGSTVMIDASSGLAQTNDGTAITLDAGDIFAGIAMETANSTDFAAGAVDVKVYRSGSFLLTFSDTLTQADVGSKVYVNNTTDDSVVTVTSDETTVQVTIWEIVEFVSASTAYVSIDKYVGYVGKIGTLSDNAVDTNDITAAAVTKSKISYEIKTVTVTTGQTSGTATVVTGWEVVWIISATNQDQFVDNVAISGTTLTVTLAAAATADNVFKVFVLKA